MCFNLPCLYFVCRTIDVLDSPEINRGKVKLVRSPKFKNKHVKCRDELELMHLCIERYIS